MLSLETHTRFGVPHPLVKHTEDVTAVRKLRTPAGRHVHYSSDDISVNKVTPQLAVHGRPPPLPPPDRAAHPAAADLWRRQTLPHLLHLFLE